jgi:glycosyltransferase involved in cell wall biosynthesis
VYFSLIIPVYNRPEEINELLESLSQTDYKLPFEVVIVEDGSSIPCRDVTDSYRLKLNISYYYKENTGPGDSRNYGMEKAKGDYFLIFDSDCIIPMHYLNEVANALEANYCDCFGGPDKALGSFSDIQKAINFAMTSMLTTGGVRGGSEKIDKFQPRSFNMGLSRKAFEASGGFGNIHPGEDPELAMRLWRMGFQTRLFGSAYVYHKRRIDWEKFTLQVNKFGKARPILDSRFPEYAKLTYWFPSLFVIGFYVSLVLLIFARDFPLKLYFIYFFLVLLFSAVKNKSFRIGFLSIIAVWRQFMGYGHGFAESFVKIRLLKRKPEEAFPELFFKS